MKIRQQILMSTLVVFACLTCSAASKPEGPEAQFAVDLHRELLAQHFTADDAAAATNETMRRSTPLALRKLRWSGESLNQLLVSAIQQGCVVKLEGRDGQILATGFAFWCSCPGKIGK